MSCESLNQQAVQMTVSMGALPEGFCAASMQELANAISSRLIVTPNQAFTSFAIGSVEPSSNVGPWLKDCLEWWVFDDTIARYRPISNNQLTRMQVFDINGGWTNNFNASLVYVQVWGGGGGGGNDYGGGGGGGGYASGYVSVTNGTTYPVVVGSGGAPLSAGSNSSFSGIVGMGGAGGPVGPASTRGGLGGSGTSAGGEVVAGNGGGAGDDGDIGGHGGGSGKGGGGAPAGTGVGINGAAPGGGGSGGSGATGGTGANGRVIIIY